MGAVSVSRRHCVPAFIALIAFLWLISGCPNVALKDYIQKVATFTGILYISAQTGNDDNEGTKESPLATIQAGIDQGVEYIKEGLGDTIEVRVAEGTYSVNSQQGDWITMKEGVSLIGGYSLDFSSQDPSVHGTTIFDTSTTGGMQENPNVVVRMENGISPATVLDGFTIQAGGGNISSALLIVNSSPVVRNNVINGGMGSVTACAVGISDHSSPQILDNTISGGSSSMSVGIAIAEYSEPVVKNNTISGGNSSTSSYGMAIGDFSEPVVEYNTISGGTDSNSATGIFNYENSSYTIQYNTVTGGTGATTCAINNEQYSKPTIQWNDIYGGDATVSSYGIQCNHSNCMIAWNTIHGGTSAGTCVGIRFSNGGDPEIFTIIGVNIVFGGNAGTIATGIEADRAPGNCPIILSTIDGGIGSTVIGIKVSGGSTIPGIANNIIFVSGSTGAAWCVDLSGNGNGVGAMGNNDLWDRTGATVLYRNEAGAEFDTESAVNGAGSGISGNVSTDPLFADIDGLDGSIESIEDNDWQLTSATPVNVRQGGLDISLLSGGGWKLDMNNVVRTNLTQGPNDNPTNSGEGWSMGVYEKD